MLILAGVSLNAIVGDNGIISNAQKANIMSKFANYKEEMEMNEINTVSNNGEYSTDGITVLNEYVSKYIPSLKEEDIGKFGIICGELYYLGENELEYEVALSQGIKVKKIDEELDSFVEDIEEMAVINLMEKLAGSDFLKVEGNENNKGVELKNKQSGVSDWKIVVEVEPGTNTVLATYGTGWYYLEKGVEVANLGILKNSYIVNYNNSDEFEHVVKMTKNHSILSDEFTDLVVADGLLFTINPRMIEDASVDSNLGADFRGFDNINDSITNTSFIFDGYDDMVLINLNGNDESIENLKTKGFTLEFYGSILGKGGTWYKRNGTIVSSNDKHTVNGIMSFTQFDPYVVPSTLFVLDGRTSTINNKDYLSYLLWYCDGGRWGTKWDLPGFEQDERFFIDKEFGEDFYFDLVIDAENLTETVYLDGKFVDSVKFNSSKWDYFKNSIFKNINYVVLGWQMNSDGGGYFGNCEFHLLNFYDRPLTDTDIRANYNNVVAYTSTLIDEQNGETGGNLGTGTNFDE